MTNDFTQDGMFFRDTNITLNQIAWAMEQADVSRGTISGASEGCTDSILTEAEQIVNGSRQTDYGTAQESFDKIARLASELTCKQITARDVCMVMIAVKLTRETFKHKRDNLVDLVGYAELLNRLDTEA